MSLNRTAVVLGAQGLVIFALVVSALAANQNNIKGTVVGQMIGQPREALPDISVQVFEAAGTEVASRRTNHLGAFNFGLDPKNGVYRLIIWDERNRWWGREIPDLTNDATHVNLPSILLRPQTTPLNNSEKREQNVVISWLRKHNTLSAAVMELHLGAFDRPGQPEETYLAGASAGGPYPVSSAWAQTYQRNHPGVAINFQAVGSGGGIAQVSAATVDFGTSERRLSPRQVEAAKRPLEQLPVALSATVPIYHSSRLPPNLHLSGPVLAGIFLGQIKSWSDPQLEKINPDAKLPDLAITVIHRADLSGSSYRLSSYLSQSSPEWRERVGASSAIAWPVGRGGRGDEGVAGQVNEIDGAIGYVSYGFPNSASIRTALLENLQHRFVAASPSSIAAGFRETGDLANLPDSSASSKDPDAYPISGVTWILLSPPTDARKGITLLDFIRYSLTGDTGRQLELGSVPLPPRLLQVVDARLNEIAATYLNQSARR